MRSWITLLFFWKRPEEIRSWIDNTPQAVWMASALLLIPAGMPLLLALAQAFWIQVALTAYTGFQKRNLKQFIRTLEDPRVASRLNRRWEMWMKQVDLSRPLPIVTAYNLARILQIRLYPRFLSIQVQETSLHIPWKSLVRFSLVLTAGYTLFTLCLIVIMETMRLLVISLKFPWLSGVFSLFGLILGTYWVRKGFALTQTIVDLASPTPPSLKLPRGPLRFATVASWITTLVVGGLVGIGFF